MATIVAVERNWIGREAAVDRLIQIVDFLSKADSYHGIYPHFVNGDTGKAIAFGRLDDAADVVETSYLMKGLLSARAYFNGNTVKERYLVKRINEMWDAANWNWHAHNDSNKFRPPDLTDFSMTPNRRLSAVRCQETDFRCC